MGALWIIVGAVIGMLAASNKGFSIIGGIIGGALLGPLAILMFLCSNGKKRCPFCAEWIHKKANMCHYCHRGV
jgi:hypothetical protein